MSRQYGRFFIYEGKGVSAPCLEDTRAFLDNPDKFPASVRPAVLGKHNLDGLKASDHPVLVIPGGNAFHIGKELFRLGLTQLIPEWVNQQGFAYLGICAGALLATRTAEAYVNYHDTNRSTVLNAYYGPLEGHDAAGKSYSLSLKLAPSSYKGMGGFALNDGLQGRGVPSGYLDKYVPYRAALQWKDDVSYSLLFSRGSGFHRQTSTVPHGWVEHAHYTGDPFVFNELDIEGDVISRRAAIPPDKLPAIISRQASSSPDGRQKGAVLLSGVHPEATREGPLGTPNGSLYRFTMGYAASGGTIIPLRGQDRETLEEQREDANAYVTDLISDVLSPKM